MLEDVSGTRVETEDGLVERIASKILLTHHLGLSGAQINDFHTKRLGRVMRRLGWQGPEKMRAGGKEEGRPVQGYGGRLKRSKVESKGQVVPGNLFRVPVLFRVKCTSQG